MVTGILTFPSQRHPGIIPAAANILSCPGSRRLDIWLTLKHAPIEYNGKRQVEVSLSFPICDPPDTVHSPIKARKNSYLPLNCPDLICHGFLLASNRTLSQCGLRRNNLYHTKTHHPRQRLLRCGPRTSRALPPPLPG